GELVAAGVDAEFQRGRQTVALHGEGNHGEVFGELFFKLLDIADVIDAFIETAGEFRRDGLDGNTGVGNGGENQEQLGGSLRRIGFVHGNFGHEGTGRLPGGEVAVDLSGFVNRE